MFPKRQSDCRLILSTLDYWELETECQAIPMFRHLRDEMNENKIKDFWTRWMVKKNDDHNFRLMEIKIETLLGLFSHKKYIKNVGIGSIICDLWTKMITIRWKRRKNRRKFKKKRENCYFNVIVDFFVYFRKYFVWTIKSFVVFHVIQHSTNCQQTNLHILVQTSCFVWIRKKEGKKVYEKDEIVHDIKMS